LQVNYFINIPSSFPVNGNHNSYSQLSISSAQLPIKINGAVLKYDWNQSVVSTGGSQ